MAVEGGGVMGEYARDFILGSYGVDIGDDDEEAVIRPKKDWKWTCKLCGKPLGSEQANKDHTRVKHPKKDDDAR